MEGIIKVIEKHLRNTKRIHLLGPTYRKEQNNVYDPEGQCYNLSPSLSPVTTEQELVSPFRKSDSGNSYYRHLRKPFTNGSTPSRNSQKCNYLQPKTVYERKFVILVNSGSEKPSQRYLNRNKEGIYKPS